MLITYKGKILLMHRDDSPIIKSAWCFIEVTKEKNKSFEESIFSKLKKEIGITITKPTQIPLTSSSEENYFYHAELTDKDVNNINREEGQALEFFTFREVKKLSLTPSAATFIDQERAFLEKVVN